MKQRCETCPTISDCKTAFGKYWNDKSAGGTGCNHPFGYRRVSTADLRIGAKGEKCNQPIRQDGLDL